MLEACLQANILCVFYEFPSHCDDALKKNITKKNHPK